MCVSRGILGPVIVGLDLTSGAVIWQLELEALRGVQNLPSDPSFSRIIVLGRRTVAIVLTVGRDTFLFRIDVDDVNTHERTLSWAEADLTLTGYNCKSVFSTTEDGSNVLYLIVADSSFKSFFAVRHPQSSSAPSSSLPSRSFYLTDILGKVQTYKIGAAVRSSPPSSHQLLKVTEVASAAFESNSEMIVSVTDPIPGDPLNSRQTTLGDDSLLLKYLNTHTALIATVSPPEAAQPYYNPKDDEEASNLKVHLTLLDTVSAKVIYRTSLDSAAAPVHALLVENTIIVTYWNAKAKRCELSSIALYEGMIDRYGLTPFASKQSAAATTALSSRNNFSAYSSFGPLAMQKTFVLPKTVTAIQHTTTSQGIANKNVLLGFASGQVYSLDTRQISPRRPSSEPSIAEREEGLAMYHPFILLQPQATVTYNYELGRGPRGIVSAPARLESSSLVFSFGKPDIHFSRVNPSGGFDLLASDFNHEMLVALLLLLAAIVYVLRSLSRSLAMKQAWV